MDEIRIALFGFVGGLLRYMVIGYFINHSTVLGTLIINLIGCFGLGLVNHFLALQERIPATITLAIGTGLIGAFTTFSTFTYDIFNLIQQGHYLDAFSYLLSSIILGLVMSYLGVVLGDNLRKKV
ncbi:MULTISPECIES: fluoride efflux transporter CrcB [Lactobacillaceae]|uniref:Fluoride-specific ion channel FluC n=1 Tax=Fructilactobacillus sanfranciscensis TaxID=1625 RepID=A0A5C4THI6_FRUSA|nr:MULTISPECIES: fluoride efflux transporter CrcB [Lactobacillaceae]MCT3282929.1 fluoride efflux transporter CrcB [Lactiplantibacillus pentosus]TNK89902.1 fluoride efflux transporter CrcB [Fructilactobacillus sanfranciscensis]